MSAAKHTPGLEAIGNLVRSSMAQEADRPRGILIAECLDGFGLHHTDEAKANAALFAGAEALLDVAQTVLALADINTPRELIDKAGAAIAKATGSAA